MTKYKGFVIKIFEKSGKGKRGVWYLYSSRLQDEKGVEIDKWFSHGFEKPNIKEGDYVEYTVVKDGDFDKVSEITQLKNAPAKTVSLKDTGGKASTTQQSIHFQSARKDAIQIVGLLTTLDGLPISSAKTSAGKAKRYEEVMALVDKLTVRFYHDSESLRVLNGVSDEGEADDIEIEEPVENIEESDDDE